MLVDLKSLKDNERFGQGCYRAKFAHNGDKEIFGSTCFSDLPRAIDPYGVVDTPQQYINECAEQLEKAPGKYVVMFTHVKKDSDWRWYKWGPYLGNKEPSCEYLRDEEGFENGVWCFSVHEVSDAPEVVTIDPFLQTILEML